MPKMPYEVGSLRVAIAKREVAMTGSTSANDSLTDIPQLAGVTHIWDSPSTATTTAPGTSPARVRLSLAGTIARAWSSTRASPRKPWRVSGWVAAAAAAAAGEIRC